MASTKIINVLTLAIVVFMIVKNSNANNCIDEITNLGSINRSDNAQEAFEFIYHTMTLYKMTGTRKTYLYSYIVGLFNVINLSINFNNLEDPMTWCMKNITIRYKVSANGKKRKLCRRDLSKVFLVSTFNAQKAFQYAYYHVGPSNIFRGMGAEYIMYMLNTIRPFISASRAVGPEEYCNRGFKSTFVPTSHEDQSSRLKSAECIDQITDFGMMDRNFNGQKALEFAYHNYSYYNTSGHNRNFVGEYFNGLYNQLILSTILDVLKSPLDWCLENINYELVEPDGDKEQLCNNHLKKSYFKRINNGINAFQYAYLYKGIFQGLTGIGLEYYQYMIDTVLPFVHLSGVVGPEEYCYGGFKQPSTLVGGQIQTVDSNQIPINQSQIAGSSGLNQSEQGRHLNIDSNILGESSSAPSGMSSHAANTFIFDQQKPDEYESFYSSNTLFSIPFGYPSNSDMRSFLDSTQNLNDEFHPTGSFGLGQSEQARYLNVDSNILGEFSSATFEVNPNAANSFVFDQQKPAIQGSEQFPNTTDNHPSSSSSRYDESKQL